MAGRPTTLITGVNGFAGSHLAELLVASGEVLTGTTFGDQRVDLPSVVRSHELDLRDSGATLSLLDDLQPAKIYHLAGFAAVGASYTNPRLVFDVNFGGTLNLFEAIRQVGFTGRVLLVSSAEVYGAVPGHMQPITESSPLAPLSPYAASKAAAEMLASSYRAASRGSIEVVIARPFNHIGPRQSEDFVCADFARRIAATPDGGTIRVGNLDTRRDFTDVRDIVAGYRLIMERGADGEVYNLASGAAVSIRELLDRLIAISGKRLAVEVDPQLYRPTDIPVLLGDATQAHHRLGWRPEHSLKESLAEISAVLR